eukprot:CAMPEP_0172677160 /NCGR_PEP_ID=MMETSP1074-20121228/14479_1 /TAXON_ID=2916 /ORGANISM="Ceratium fusus, Strain PA161109" /LENGTH=222 /DNA_ID=CAMNT_0013494945 /DNA_START=210 /DNA_END=879 /DNA_ORIENTATION=+
MWILQSAIAILGPDSLCFAAVAGTCSDGLLLAAGPHPASKREHTGVRAATYTFIGMEDSKVVSIVTYGWFILGVVWLLNFANCKSCPGLYRLSLAVIFTAVARLLMTLIVFYHSFPPRRQTGVPPASKPRGATQEVIDSMPLVEFTPDLVQKSNLESSCAVCLSEFEWGHMLRQLPCGHNFHRMCIDRWLKRNKVCPLCLQDIETSPVSLPKRQSAMKDKVA